jgi:copper chaperone CopZ
MRKAFLYLFILVSFVCAPLSAYAERISVSVKGMVCSFCAQGIKKTFGRKDVVVDVAVDLERKIVTITTKDGTTLADNEIRESIIDAGYEVLEITRG